MTVLLLLGFLGGLACSTASPLNSTEAVQATLASASSSVLIQSPVMAPVLAAVLLPIAVWFLYLRGVTRHGMATFRSRTNAPPSVAPQDATTQAKTTKQTKGCFAIRNQKKADKKAKEAMKTSRLSTPPPTKQATTGGDASVPPTQQVATDGFQEVEKGRGGKKTRHTTHPHAFGPTIPFASATTTAHPAPTHANDVALPPCQSFDNLPASERWRAAVAATKLSCQPQGTGHKAPPAQARNARQVPALKPTLSPARELELTLCPNKCPVPAPAARGQAGAAPPPAQEWTFASVVHGALTGPKALVCDIVPLAQPSKEAFPPISAAKPVPYAVKRASPSKKTPPPSRACKASQSAVVPDTVPDFITTAAADMLDAAQETPTSPLSASCVLSLGSSTSSDLASPTTSSISNLVLPEVVSDCESDLPTSHFELSMAGSVAESAHTEEACAQPVQEPSISTHAAEQASEPRLTDDGAAQSHAPALPACKPCTARALALAARKTPAQLQCAALYTHGHNTIVRSIQSSSTDSTDSEQTSVQLAPEPCASTCETEVLSPAGNEQCMGAQAVGAADSTVPAEPNPAPVFSTQELDLLTECAASVPTFYNHTIATASAKVEGVYLAARQSLATVPLFDISLLTEGYWEKQRALNPKILPLGTKPDCDVSVYSTGAEEVVVKQYNNLAQWLVLRPFCSEVRVHTALGDSPYFMPLKAAVMDPHTGTGVLVMPKAHGDLRQWIKHAPTYRLTVLKYLVDICMAVEKLHEAGLLHGDIKPDNCFFYHFDNPTAGQCNRAVLGDFGTAEDAHSDTPRHYSGGTPLYMPQEQARLWFTNTPGVYDWRVDVYALAVLIHLVYTGFSPLYSNGVNLGDMTQDQQIEAVSKGLVECDVNATKIRQNKLWKLLNAALSQDMHKRPTAKSLRIALAKMARRESKQ